MKRIIDIPEADFDLIKNYANWHGSLSTLENIEKAIINSTPLDEMITEIRECAYDEPDGYVCFCDREPDKIVSLEDVEDIIHKYCDKGAER